ncbi:MAG: FtsX-like permease family protein [Nonlabens sp.]
MNFSLYIARRYLISKNGRGAINIINFLSFFITVIGTAALFIVLSGFSGLKDLSTSFSSYFDPDLKVTAVYGKTIPITPSIESQLSLLPGVEEVAPIIEEKTFLNYEGKNHIAFIKGVPDHYDRIIEVDSVLYEGTWLTGIDLQVVVGYGIAQKLSLPTNQYGSFLQIMVPRPGKGAINALNYGNSFTTLDVVATGIFAAQNEDLNNTYVFSTLPAARQLLRYGDSVATAVELKLSPAADEDELRSQIRNLYDVEVEIKNKQQLNDTLYRMLNSENIAVYLIFTLVLVIALFNVVGSIIMMILDKKRNLRTLIDLGADVHSLRQIFFIQGSLMTIAGGLIGILLGVGFVYAQLQFELIYINPALPYPFRMEFFNLVVSFATIAVLGILASHIGSRRINKRLLDQAKL